MLVKTNQKHSKIFPLMEVMLIYRTPANFKLPQSNKNLSHGKNKQNARVISGKASPILNNSQNINKILANFNKSSTVHSNMLGSNLGFTDSLVKSTAAGTNKDQVRV
jgi:hypothetical protein